MHFVDDGVLQRDFEGPVVFPVVAVLVKEAARLFAEATPCVAPVSGMDLPGIRVEQDACRVKGVPFAGRIIGAANSVSIAHVQWGVAKKDVPDVSGFMNGWIKGKFNPVGSFWVGGNHQGDRFGMT